MAQWCFDRAASRQAGAVQFHLPYPNRGDWWETQRWNDMPIRAMRLVLQAEVTFRKPMPSWDKADNDLFLWMKRATRYFSLLEMNKDDWTENDATFLSTYEPPRSWWEP